jgi:hypothetical protein
MNEHLDKYLCEKYPKIFADRNKSPMESCMHWGISCNDGWFHILDIACDTIQQHIDRPKYVEKRFNSVKRLYNRIVWNFIIYPIAKLVAFGEFSKKGFTVSANQHSKKRWVIYDWFYKWFQFDITYEPSKIPIPQLVADQVKEKFSSLRFYCHGGDDYTRAVIDFAESLSYHVCEDCGSMDETVDRNSRGWIRTTCEKCTHKDDLEDHKNNRNKERAVLFEKVLKSKK